MRFYLLAFLLFSFTLIGPCDLHAKGDNDPKTYTIKRLESIDTLAAKLLPRFKISHNNRIDDLKEDLRKWNPHITNWAQIPIFSTIYIEYPYPIYISHPYAPRLEEGKNIDISNSDAETPLRDSRYLVFAMYTASSGTLQEQLTTQTGSINSSQNSPISLGLGSTVFLDKNNRMLNTSFYWSSLRASKLSGTDTTSNSLGSSSEYGANLYYQQLSPWLDLSFYGGVDYEQLPTFNTTAFINGNPLAFNQNKIFYGTFGLGRSFFWGDQKILLKTAFSQSLKSSTTSPDPVDKFEGQRLLFFASIKGESRFTYHLLYKRHMLSGPTKLTINRIGIGVGFVIF